MLNISHRFQSFGIQWYLLPAFLGSDWFYSILVLSSLPHTWDDWGGVKIIHMILVKIIIRWESKTSSLKYLHHFHVISRRCGLCDSQLLSNQTLSLTCRFHFLSYWVFICSWGWPDCTRGKFLAVILGQKLVPSSMNDLRCKTRRKPDEEKVRPK